MVDEGLLIMLSISIVLIVLFIIYMTQKRLQEDQVQEDQALEDRILEDQAQEDQEPEPQVLEDRMPEDQILEDQAPERQALEVPIAKMIVKRGFGNEDEGSSICTICGSPLSGFGRFGGFCNSCMEWNYDRGLYLFQREKYGPSAESLFILAAYEMAHYRCQGGDYLGTLYVTPGSLIFTDGNSMRFILLFSDVTKVSATRGKAQQLTVLVQGEEYVSGYHNFDLQGSSYDGADGEDLLRVSRLIQSWEEAV